MEIKYITPLHIPVSGDVPIILIQLKYMTRIVILRSTFTEITLQLVKVFYECKLQKLMTREKHKEHLLKISVHALLSQQSAYSGSH